MMDEERGKGRREGERREGGGKKGEGHTYKHRE